MWKQADTLSQDTRPLQQQILHNRDALYSGVVGWCVGTASHKPAASLATLAQIQNVSKHNLYVDVYGLRKIVYSHGEFKKVKPKHKKTVALL